jgi:hypothetical protein
MERSYPGFAARLQSAPQEAIQVVQGKKKKWDLPFLYWTAASLGLGIAVSGNDPAMLARLPEVDALVARALVLDEDWDDGAFHSFQVTYLGSKPGSTDYEAVTRHYNRALELSAGKSAALFVDYAEAVAVPRQDRSLFQELLQRALAVDPDANKERRLQNVLAQRRARRLRDRIDELFLNLEEPAAAPPGLQP